MIKLSSGPFKGLQRNGYPTVEEVRRSPELYDGVGGGQGCATDKVIGSYLALLQAERDDDPERCNDSDPIDRRLEAFEEWTDWWANKAERRK